MDGDPPVAEREGASLSKPLEEMSLPTDGKTPREGFGLTRGELEVVGKLAAGWSTKSIACDLAISKGAVNRCIEDIFDKLCVSNRLELVLFVAYHQVMDHPESKSDSPWGQSASWRASPKSRK